MSPWMWDLVGALLALFVVVVTVVDLLVAFVLIGAFGRRVQERRRAVPAPPHHPPTLRASGVAGRAAGRRERAPRRGPRVAGRGRSGLRDELRRPSRA